MLLREVERHLNLFPRLAACFTDYRDAAKTEHPVEHLLKQRIYALALGYEDINDHDELRHDSQLAMLCSKPDVTGADRKRSADRGVPLASSSTLNRLEPENAPLHRYKKITGSEAEMNRLLPSQQNLSTVVETVLNCIRQCRQRLRPGRSYPRESKQPRGKWVGCRSKLPAQAPG